MRRTSKWALAMMTAVACTATASGASALLLENVSSGDPDLVYFYPYPTTYRQIDYAFEDDPLTAYPREPYEMPVEVKRVSVSRTLVKPRASFVPEMCRSADVL